MSGKPKIKVYQYDKDGKYLTTYSSQSEARSKYYSDFKGKYPMFVTNENYQLLPDGTYLVRERIGRDGIKNMIKRSNNHFVDIKPTNRVIKVYNLDNREIASFIDIQTAVKLTKVPHSTIFHQLNRPNTRVGSTDLGILFKYVNING